MFIVGFVLFIIAIENTFFLIPTRNIDKKSKVVYYHNIKE